VSAGTTRKNGGRICRVRAVFCYPFQGFNFPEECNDKLDFSQIFTTEMVEKIGPDVRNERKNLIFTRGPKFFFQRQNFCHVWPDYLERSWQHDHCPAVLEWKM
jgi:hypothetical protein